MMSEEKTLRINPNIADETTLQELPGIGPSLAKRIVDSRPFSRLDELKNIQGIGTSILERIAPMLTLEEMGEDVEIRGEEEIPQIEMPKERSPGVEVEAEIASPEEQQIEALETSQSSIDTITEAEAITEEATGEKVEKPSRPEAAKKPRLVRAFSRTETIWLVVAVGVLSLILSVLLNLVILGGINGTLDFNQLKGLKQAESDLGVLEKNLLDLSSDLDAFDQRLTPLEGLSGRMTVVEDLTETLQADVENALASVDSMQSDLERLSDETARLSGRVDRFDTFLDGLRRLIDELFAEPSPEPLPES